MIELREHQQEPYNGIKQEFEDGNRAALIHPTGTGKGHIGLKIVEDNQGKRVLYLAPSNAILHQVKENAIKYNGKMFSNLVRMTYQKLARLSREEMAEIKPDIIILDEFHHCGAPVWGEAVKELCEMFPNAKVLGLSATPIRYFDGNIDMAKEMFGEHIVSEISFTEAIEKEILPDFDYISAMYGYEDKLIQLKEQIEISKVTQSKKDEAKRLYEELSKQLSKDTENLPEVLEKHMTNKNGKYMVFCSNIENMQKKMQDAQKLFSKINPNIKIYSVSSSEDLKNNNKVLKKFENDNDENSLKLMFSVNMLNEGYHLTDIDGVVMMRPTKSPTVYMQQMGRALTVGNSNKKPVIIDLVDNFDSIRVIEEVTGTLREGTKGNGYKSEELEKKFKIIDYTKNIGEISRKIEKLSRVESLSISEKINLFEKFIEENPNETIHGDTVFEGYPIGSYLIQIRSDINLDKNSFRYSEQDKEKLEKLGLLYEKKDSIENKIVRLKEFCEKYPYAFFDMSILNEIFEKEGESKKTEYLEELARVRKSYEYIKVRKSKGKLSEEIVQELKEARIGGVFGFLNEDEELMQKYKIENKIIIQLLQDFNTIDNFRKAYIQYKIDFVNAETHEEKRNLMDRNENLLKYRQYLPLVEDFDLCCKKGYHKLVRDILKRDEPDYWLNESIIIEENFDEILNSMLDGNITEKQKKVIELRLGINGDKEKTFSDIGEQLNLSSTRVNQLYKRAIRNIRGLSGIRTMGTQYGYFTINKFCKPTEEFIREYFSIHDIFYSEDEQQMSKENIERLMCYCQSYQEKEDKMDEIELLQRHEDGKLYISELGISARTYNALRWKGITTTKELIENIESVEELLNIRNLGRTSVEEIVEKIHSLGLKFEFEGKQIDIVYLKTIDHIELLQLHEEGRLGLKELGFPSKACKIFKFSEIRNTADLLSEFEDPKELRRIYGLGETIIAKIVEKVHSLGLKFKCEEEEIKEVDLLELHKQGELGLEMLGLSTRTYNCLVRSGYRTTTELIENIEEIEDFSNIRNMGRKSRDEIIEKMHDLDLKFKYEEHEEEHEDEEIVEEQVKNPFTFLVGSMEECDSKHTVLCEELEQLKIQEEISQKIEQILEQLKEMTDGKITSEISELMKQSYKMLQEQRKMMKTLDETIIATQGLEKMNREERAKLTEKFSGMIQGGN